MDIHAQIDALQEDIKNLKENHIAHLGLDLADLKADVRWLKQMFWIVAGASVSSLVATVLKLVIK